MGEAIRVLKCDDFKTISYPQDSTYVLNCGWMGNFLVNFGFPVLENREMAKNEVDRGDTAAPGTPRLAVLPAEPGMNSLVRLDKIERLRLDECLLPFQATPGVFLVIRPTPAD